jgi:thioredoxin-dependent peroxiredoxin
MLQPGDRVPDLSLPASGGKTVRLADLLGQKTLVVYFYPKDETSGCTAEACSFRDSYEDFLKAGAEVVGISADSVASHESFARNHRLPFILLSDPEGKARQGFDVGKAFLGLADRRVTFVVDRAGIVRHVSGSQLRPTLHVAEALEVIRSLEAGSSPQP